MSLILLHDFLARTAADRPERAAVVCDGSSQTFRQIEEASARLAAALQAGGVERGDRVALCLHNSAAWVISFSAILRAGGVCVPIAPSIAARKLQFLLRDCEPAAIIGQATLAATINEAAIGLAPLIVLVGAASPPIAPVRSFEAIVASSQARLADPHLIDHDLAAIIYTSGSSGEPRGVMLTHRNLVNSTTAISTYLGNVEEDVVCCALPLSYSYGLCQVLASVRVGYSLLLESSFTYPMDMLRRMQAHGATGLPAAPTMLARLLEMFEQSNCALPSLRYITNAAAALPVAHLRRLRAALPKVSIFCMYGQTECTRATYLDPALVEDRAGSVGKAMPNCEAYVVDESGGRAATNQSGELIVRGGNVMRGYWRRPDLTAQRLREGEIPGELVLHTGDHFRTDEDGFLYFLGRSDDIFKCRGEKVSPAEIEHALCELPDVVQAAIVGVEDPLDGHAIKATIVLREGSNLTEQAVRRHCRTSLDPILMPKFITFIRSLPQTDSGKVHKRRLREAHTRT